MPSSRFVYAALASIGLLSVLFLARSSSAQAQPVAQIERKPNAVVYFTGNVVGFLEECGCPQLPLGGLDRRSSYLLDEARALGDTPRMIVDIGDFSDVPGPAGAIKTRGLVKAMGQLEYVASGIGRQDMAQGGDVLTELRDSADFPFMSANVVLESTGQPWLQSELIHDLGPLKVGMTAITQYDPTRRVPLPDGDALLISKPESVLGPAIRRLKEAGSEYVVVLALMPFEETRALATQVPGIDLILAAHGERAVHDPFIVGDTSILYVGDQGKYLGEVKMFFDEAGDVTFDSRMIPLSRALDSDPRMTALVIEVMAEANQADLDQYTVLGAAGDALAQFMGVGSCTGCHVDIVKSWSESRHAHAFETLERKTEGVQPSCIPCHVTGYGQETGFSSKDETPHLIGVGCESCHGPASLHVQDTSRPYGKTSLGTCTSCHDAKQDPDFDYYRTLPLVNHSQHSSQ